MNGDCTGGSIVDVGFYGPVLITPQGNSLTWFNQASATYTFSRTGPDTYIYSGPDLTFDGAAAMTLRFTSAATFVMQRVFTPTNDSGCQHTYNYTGTFWYYR